MLNDGGGSTGTVFSSLFDRIIIILHSVLSDFTRLRVREFGAREFNGGEAARMGSLGGGKTVRDTLRRGTQDLARLFLPTGILLPIFRVVAGDRHSCPSCLIIVGATDFDNNAIGEHKGTCLSAGGGGGGCDGGDGGGSSGGRESRARFFRPPLLGGDEVEDNKEELASWSVSSSFCNGGGRASVMSLGGESGDDDDGSNINGDGEATENKGDARRDDRNGAARVSCGGGKKTDEDELLEDVDGKPFIELMTAVAVAAEGEEGTVFLGRLTRAIEDAASSTARRTSLTAAAASRLAAA